MDIVFSLPVKNGAPKSHSQYVRNLKARLEENYQIATRNSQKVAERNKRRFDKAVRESTLEEGDQVLVRNLRLRNKHKLTDKWEPTMYKVLKRMGDLPVFTVHPINGDGPSRTLHRDLLLPCGDLSETEEIERPEPKARRPRTRRSQTQPLEEHSESEDELPFCPTQLSVIPEERFFQVYEIPRRQQTTVTPAAGDNNLPAMPMTSSNSQPQNEPILGSSLESPAEPVGTPPEMIEGHEPEIMYEQPTTGKNLTSPGVTNVIPAVEYDSDVCPVSPDDPGNGEAVDEVQQNGLPQTLKIEDGKTDDSTRKSERLRRPPDHFHYLQLGKPLVSLAQSLLESLNQAIDIVGGIDSFHRDPISKHEGTHAESRGEGVTHMKHRATKTIYVV